jgi:outer membrane protein OmpA-like peptidoglycan-associated protein
MAGQRKTRVAGTATIIVFIIMAALLQQCRSKDGCAFCSSTQKIASSKPSPLLLAPASATGCEEIGRKRIVRLFYLWPTNSLTEEELKPTILPARRYRTEVTSGDLGWSFLGFMLGVVTETSVVEACDSRYVLRDRSVDETPVRTRTGIDDAEVSLDFPNLVVNTQRPRTTFSVYFAPGSSVLSSDEKQRLAQMAAELKKKPAAKLIIIGHADRTGEEKKNYLLSRERAAVVRKALIQAGLSSDILIPVAAGSTWPAGNTSYYAMARRTEIVIFREDNHDAP